ncbi:hypothetical protein [Caballeronia mineralivorans]|uniref:hypothetical protein n=1 Tax=Caballeronia mineralivorans TaxID=2010198 RepID=UPI000AEBDA22|nr:hypothetical protein [Caballeronia mineralivorans]
MIALSKKIGTFALESNATGLLMNDGGDVLTARHVIEACKSLLSINARDREGADEK